MSRARAMTDDEIRQLIEAYDSDDDETNVVNLIQDDVVEESDFEDESVINIREEGLGNIVQSENEQDEIDVRVKPPVYKKKIQTKYQLNSIDSSLEPNNYDNVDGNVEK